jgi:hypothetical protein
MILLLDINRYQAYMSGVLCILMYVNIYIYIYIYMHVASSTCVYTNLSVIHYMPSVLTTGD